MCEENNKESQEDELFALKGIYCDNEVIDNRKSEWSDWSPLDILITLKPLHSENGVHCSVILQFICCHEYPNKPPKILINKSVGLSDENRKKLLDDLDNYAEKLCRDGEVMIYQLAQYTRQFLDKHNKPILSFYEEMVKEKDKMEKLKQHDLKVKENEELQKIKVEIQRREETLQGRDSDTVSLNSEDMNGQGDVQKLVYYADDKMSPARKISKKNKEAVTCTCNFSCLQTLRCTQRNSKKVYLAKCIGHSSNGSTTFPAIDDDGKQLIVKEWIIPPTEKILLRNRQLNSIQKDLKAMCHLKNPSLTPYIAMETKQKKVYLFRDYVVGSSLKLVLDMQSLSGCKNLKFLRCVGLGVFSALKELHNVDVLHRDVRRETVFVDKESVKLVSASLDVRLAEIMDGDTYCDRQTKSQDIYAAAQLLLSIVTEDPCQEIPSDLPSSAKDFFSRCLTEDENVQWSAEQLVNHGFLIDTPAVMPNGNGHSNADSEIEEEDSRKRIQDINTLVNGHSRLNEEFEVLDWLGKGAFGDVLKVRNKLDGGFYAIKHVKLNPKNVELYKKITREVKLLSRLNHENVVRYYNAWIETIIESDVENSEDSEADDTPVKKKESRVEELHALLEQEIQLDWSIADGPVQVRDDLSDNEDDSDDSGESDDSDDPPWFNATPVSGKSSSIEFEMNSIQSLTMPSEDIPFTPIYKKVLSIQMEFCEKNTLRQAIDNSLYKDHIRAWRLFREILEGLAHVHQKGMIHRDLKPVNIFLDSNDHVKIGDFGLATKVFTGVPIVENNPSAEDVDELLTSQVGTALYVAPELQQSACKVIYNQKVDIYSLGIILFEMFYPPFTTTAERYGVVTNLRKKEIIIPKEFEENNPKQIHVIRWLLDHDASSRPTSQELLTSEHVPRAVPEVELSGAITHTLSDRSSRGYLRLISECLNQKPSPAVEYTYHRGMKMKSMDAVASIKDLVIKVFREHGATEFYPPLLLPLAERWARYPNAVRVMTSSGTVCHLPHDLRLPFARHTAYSGTKYMRRYVVDRVYRETEKTVKGFHPREIIECAFDIVTPKTDTLWTDSELLVVATRAASEISLKVFIQLNHTELLSALLSSCGVPSDKHPSLYPVLVDVTLGRITRLQLQTHLTTLCVTDRDITNIRRLIDANVTVDKLRELVGSIAKNKWSHKVESSIQQLEVVCSQADGFGCNVPITVAPFLAYNAMQHSGIFWQMSVIHDQGTVKNRSRNLIAAGGRYDNLVKEFWGIARAEKEHYTSLNCTSVGFSMSLERMATLLKGVELDSSPVIKDIEQTTVCICICTDNQSSLEMKIAQELWACGVRAVFWIGTVEDARDAHCGGVVGVRHCGERGDVMSVSYVEGNHLREQKVQSSKLIDFIKQKLNLDTTMRTPEYSNRTISWSESEKSSGPTVSVTFITDSDRLTKNSKRQCEMQINSKITSNLERIGLQQLSNRIRVSVLALACDAPCVTLLASYLVAPLEQHALARSFTPVVDAYSKYHNILNETLRELTNIVKQSAQGRFPEETHLYALYSIPDSLCRIIT
ncbi:unnamed protein product, partial [Brenthis ino]